MNISAKMCTRSGAAALAAQQRWPRQAVAQREDLVSCERARRGGRPTCESNLNCAQTGALVRGEQGGVRQARNGARARGSDVGVQGGGLVRRMQEAKHAKAGAGGAP